MIREIPVQIFTDPIKGSICFEWLIAYSHDKKKQEQIIENLKNKYNKTAYEIWQIIKEIK